MTRRRSARWACWTLAAIISVSQSAAADIGSLNNGVCYNECCYPADTQNDLLGDTFYNPLILDYNKASSWWAAYQMEATDWDDGWGFWQWWLPGKPLARLFHAMQMLQESAPTGADPSTPLVWGFGYAVTYGEEPIPDCSRANIATARTSGLDEWIQLHYLFFYENFSVVERASTLVHEARHLDQGCDHLSSTACLHQRSCDLAWDDGCVRAPLGSPRPGANQYHIVWLWDFFKNAVGTPTAMKHRAVDYANDLLAGRFVNDPCFRVGPDGKAYQLPLPVCQRSGGATDYGSASKVQPEEYQGSRCVTATTPVKSETCVAPYAGQKWSLLETPDPQHPGQPRPDGAVRIALYTPGGCLRLAQAPTPVTMPNGLVCMRVPWLTEVVVGSCDGDQAAFFVTPWAVENTWPGLTAPDLWSRWRIRPVSRCTTTEGFTAMDDGDACLDANATGDGKLRVFWCHDSPRQQFTATDWY